MQRLLTIRAPAFVAACLLTHTGYCLDLTLTTESNPEGVEQSLIDPGQPFNLTIDTSIDGQLAYCTLQLQIAESGFAPSVVERLRSSDAHRTLSIHTPGKHLFELVDCTIHERPATGVAYAVLYVTSPRSTLDPQCGPADATRRDTAPSDDQACAVGDVEYLDDQAIDGTFDWRCRTSDWNAQAICTAVRAHDLPPTADGFIHGQASNGVLHRIHELEWAFPNARECLALGDWEGHLPTSGRFRRKVPIDSATQTYRIRCHSGMGVGISQTRLR